jgi:hypothetical protein
MVGVPVAVPLILLSDGCPTMYEATKQLVQPLELRCVI